MRPCGNMAAGHGKEGKHGKASCISVWSRLVLSNLLCLMSPVSQPRVQGLVPKAPSPTSPTGLPSPRPPAKACK